MNDTDKKTFAAVMKSTATMYDKPVNTDVMRMYFGALQPYTIDQVMSAINKHVADPRHGSFMPKPADIIRQVPVQEPKQLENKGSTTWCETTEGLLAEYGPGTKWWSEQNA